MVDGSLPRALSGGTESPGTGTEGGSACSPGQDCWRTVGVCGRLILALVQSIKEVPRSKRRSSKFVYTDRALFPLLTRFV